MYSPPAFFPQGQATSFSAKVSRKQAMPDSPSTPVPPAQSPATQSPATQSSGTQSSGTQASGSRVGAARPPGPLRPLVVLGTRPEAIKLAPVLLACRERRGQVSPIVCSTGQHREMLQQVFDYFGITPDIDLALMRPNQSLPDLTALCLQSVDRVITERQPDCVIVQGDTTTVMASAMAAFYRQLPVVHVEAGLRTGDLNAPWPEEFNRRVASIVTTLHCAPTKAAARMLAGEGVHEQSIRVTGNTVIDALLHTVARERRDGDRWKQVYPAANADSVVLITGHRRESFGKGLADICGAISELAAAHPDTQFIYPVHLNPNVQQPVHQLLGGKQNVHLLPPADYPGFVWLMDRACVVLTDSGGVQEEAPSLGTAILVTREKTERPEAVEAGLAELVGTDRQTIVRRVNHFLAERKQGPKQAVAENPFGDGRAATRIVDWMLETWPV